MPKLVVHDGEIPARSSLYRKMNAFRIRWQNIGIAIMSLAVLHDAVLQELLNTEVALLVILFQVIANEVRPLSVVRVQSLL